MATYAIGDIQGCYSALLRLLERIAFEPAKDRLWFAGDIINRGPDSLQVLRFVKGLGDRAVCVLGNHDLHLLAVSQGNLRHYRDDNTIDEILRAPDREELIDWVRHRPLMHSDGAIGFHLIHAGLPPQWDIPTALERAREVENVLRGPGFYWYCQHMYGNRPDQWSDDLEGMNRLRFITNCFSRLRYCDTAGRLGLRESGPPGTQKHGLLPWFAIPGRASRTEKILFGHWSTLGYRNTHNVWALDTGCLWGGQLTALRIGERPMPFHQHCPRMRKPQVR